MVLFSVRLAELNIGIHNKYDYVKNMCADYLSSGITDFDICLSEQEIEAERKSPSDRSDYLESLAIYRKIADKLIEYDGFLLHAAIIKLDNDGIGFLAKSGVGKTTHIRLWKSLLGDKVSVINGDKPLIRIIGGKIYAFGTPWSGKEALNTNTFTELKKLCFIERSYENSCSLISSKDEIFERLITQLYRPSDKALLKSSLVLVNKLINNADFYLVRCNTDICAAETVYKSLF